MAPAYRSADSFRVPDLRGRFALGASSARPLGATGGEESHALTEAEGPEHSHTAVGGNRAFLGGGGSGSPAYIGDGDSYRVNTMAASGEGRPHNNMPPYEACNWIISTGRS